MYLLRHLQDRPLSLIWVIVLERVGTYLGDINVDCSRSGTVVVSEVIIDVLTLEGTR